MVVREIGRAFAHLKLDVDELDIEMVPSVDLGPPLNSRDFGKSRWQLVNSLHYFPVCMEGGSLRTGGSLRLVA
jgi:hypothetical protein